jgi:hypothetical protein
MPIVLWLGPMADLPTVVEINEQNAVNAYGNLQLLTPHVFWFIGDKEVDLDGEFTAAELRLIANYMDATDAE